MYEKPIIPHLWEDQINKIRNIRLMKPQKQEGLTSMNKKKNEG